MLSSSRSLRSLSKIAKESSIGTVASYLGILINYGLVWVLTHALTPDEFGVFSLGQSILGFSLVFVLLGTPKALDRFIPQYRALGEIGKVRSLIGGVSKWVGVTSALVMLLLFFLSPWLSVELSEPRLASAMQVLLLSIPAIAVQQNLSAVFLGFKNLRYRVLIERILIPVVKGLMALIILWLGLGLRGWLWAFSIASLVGSAVSLWLFNRKVWYDVRTQPAECVDFTQVLAYAWPLSISSVLSLVVGKMDILLLGYYRSSSEVGILRVYVYVVALVGVIKTSFEQIFKPVASELSAKGDLSEFSALYKRVAKWLFHLSFAVLLLFLILGRDLMNLLFPGEYLVGFSPLIIILASRSVNAAFGTEGMVLEASGRTRLSLLNMLLMLSSNFVIDVVLIPRYGILGAAVGMGAATVIGSLAGLIEIYVLYRLQPFGWRHFIYVGNGVLSAAIVSWIGMEGTTLSVVARALIFVLLYLGGLALCGGLDDADYQLISQGFRRVTGSRKPRRAAD
jgi:stage V sporulation protein B